MSASRCLRCAFEASRPSKRPFPFLNFARQQRYYAADSSGNPPTDTTASKSTKAPTVSITPEEKVGRPSKIPAESSSVVESSENAQPSKPIPPNVLAAYRTPHRLDIPSKQKRVRVADLQLRSYSVRNLEFFGDFAMRVAQYLKLPARGPEPLPKITERWTMPRSNFVHKKSQENFERITRRRVIKIYNGHRETVEVWLACLRKWQFYGVGMKANVYDWESLDVAKNMDKRASEIEEAIDKKLSMFGWNSTAAPDKSIQDMLLKQGVKHAGVPMTEVRDEIKNWWNVGERGHEE